MWEWHLKKKEILRKRRASLLKISLWDSFCLWKSTTWFIRKRNIDCKCVVPNMYWAKKISELLQTALLTLTSYIALFKNWKFWILLTIKVSYFLFFTYMKISLSTITWKENLPHLPSLPILLFLPLLQLLECLSEYMYGHKLKMKFPPDFHNYTGLIELVNSFF